MYVCRMSCVHYAGPEAPGGVAYDRDPYYPDWVCLSVHFT